MESNDLETHENGNTSEVAPQDTELGELANDALGMYLRRQLRRAREHELRMHQAYLALKG
jgi:hypothetical protein